MALEPNSPRLVFFGIGSEYAHEMMEVARRAGVEVAAWVDNMPEPGEFAGLAPVVRVEDLDAGLKQLPVLVPLVTPGHRKALDESLASLGFGAGGVLVDPTAIVASSVESGPGLQVNAAVVVGANSRFGHNVLVNRSVSIGHDARVGDYVSFGPGCLLCGSCHIDAGAFIGGGATIAPRVSVGRNAIVGAGAVVVKDVPPHTVVAGNPARVIREACAGYNDVSV